MELHKGYGFSSVELQVNIFLIDLLVGWVLISENVGVCYTCS